MRRSFKYLDIKHDLENVKQAKTGLSVIDRVTKFKNRFIYNYEYLPQQLVNFRGRVLLFSFYPENSSFYMCITDVLAKKMISLCFDEYVLNLISVDPEFNEKMNTASIWVVTSNNIVCNVSEDGCSHCFRLPYTPEHICVRNGIVVISKGSRVSICYDEKNVVDVFQASDVIAEKYSKDENGEVFLPNVVGFTFEKNNIYIVRDDSTLISYSVGNAVSNFDIKLDSRGFNKAKIKVKGDFIAILTEDVSQRVFVLFLENNVVKKSYIINVENITDFVIENDIITLIGYDKDVPKVYRLSLNNNGSFIGNDLLESLTFKGSNINKRSTKFILSFVIVPSLNSYFYVNENQIFMLRNMTYFEKIVYQSYDEELLNSNLLRYVNEIVKSMYAQEDIFDTSYLDIDKFNKDISTSEINRLIEKLDFNKNVPNQEINTDENYTNIWPSIVTQVFNTNYRFVKALYNLLSFFYEKGNIQKYEESLEKLSRIRRQYKIISVLFEKPSVLVPELFLNLNLNENNIDDYCRFQLNNLLKYDDVLNFLMSKEEYELVESYAEYTDFKNKHYVFCLLMRPESHEKLFNELKNNYNIYKNEIGEYIGKVLKVFSQHKQSQYCLELCRLYFNSNRTLCSYFLFDHHLRNENFNDAFILINETNDEIIKDSMLTRFYKSIKDNAYITSFLKERTIDEIHSLFPSLLNVTSISPLVSASLLFLYYGDYSSSAQIIYIISRLQLREPTVETLKSALRSFILIDFLIKKKNAVVRNVTDIHYFSQDEYIQLNKIITPEDMNFYTTKITAILELSSMNISDRASGNPQPLQELLKKSNREIFLELLPYKPLKARDFACSGIIKEEDLRFFVCKLVKLRFIKLLLDILDIDKPDWNYSLHVSAFEAYIQSKTSHPPLWLIQRLKSRSIFTLLNILVSLRKQFKPLLDSLLFEMKEKNEKLPRHCISLLQRAGISSEIIDDVI